MLRHHPTLTSPRAAAPLVLLFCAAAATAADGLFVAVGYGGRRMSSRDGRVWERVTEWTEQNADDDKNLMSIAFGKGRFVAVGGGGSSKQAGHILVSTDGAAWREVRTMKFRVHPVVFGDGRFVAGAPGHRLISSHDGEAWSEGAEIPLPAGVPGWAFWFRRGAHGAGTWVFAGNAGSKETATWWCAVSKDAATIAAARFDLPAISGLAFGAGRFVMTSADGTRVSADGVAWEHRAGMPGADLSGCVWDGARFVVTSKAGAFASADGFTWAPLPQRIPGSLLLAGPQGWIATAWPGKMFHSADGVAWTQGASIAPALGINAVAYGVPAP